MQKEIKEEVDKRKKEKDTFIGLLDSYNTSKILVTLFSLFPKLMPILLNKDLELNSSQD